MPTLCDGTLDRTDRVGTAMRYWTTRGLTCRLVAIPTGFGSHCAPYVLVTGTRPDEVIEIHAPDIVRIYWLDNGPSDFFTGEMANYCALRELL